MVPTVTLPKLRLLGFGVSCPGPVVPETVTPVPETATLIVEFEALLPSDRVAFAVPATVGIKLTLKTALWPGPKLNGRDGPVRLNPDPVSVACRRLRLLLPMLVAVTESVPLAPT